MRWDGFGRSLLFAALAAGGWPLFALVAAPWLGADAALRLYGVALAALYLGGLAGGFRARVAGAAAALGCGALALAATHLGEVAIGSALLVGALRSGWLVRRPLARAFATEALLLGGGLALARWVGSPGLLGVALGFWSFFLVQSLFFLVAREPGLAEPVSGDRFEHAERSLRTLLDGD